MDITTVADLTTGQMVRLPWDYQRVYGLDPDESKSSNHRGLLSPAIAPSIVVGAALALAR